jgi:hypothetical protein
MIKAFARFGGTGRIVVDDCPYCHRTHYHNPPVGEGRREADCFNGEYLLSFEKPEPAQPSAGVCTCADPVPSLEDDTCLRCCLVIAADARR